MNHRAARRLAPAATLISFCAALALAAGAADPPAAAPDRSAPPRPGAPPALVLPPVRRCALDNGMPLLLMEKRAVPLVHVVLMLRAGTNRETPDQMGLASMTAEMLDEGTATRTALELADAIEFLGATLTIDAGADFVAISLHTAKSKLAAALELMAEVVREPAFPRAELDRKKRERLTTMVQWRDEPRAVAEILLQRALYGPTHPYGWPEIGSAATLTAMTVADLEAFHAAWYRAANASLIAAGDIGVEEFLPLAEAAFGTWPRGEAATPAAITPEPPAAAPARILLVDRPDAPQSELRLGRIGAARQTEDYNAILVMNAVLGGAFTSRLNQNLREEHGYTYAAFSAFDFRLMPGPFRAATSVHADATADALSEMLREFGRIREPVPADELSRAKNYVALGFPRRFATVASIAAVLAEIAAYDLPDDSIHRFVEQVLAATPDDIGRVARRYVDPGSIVIVIVGDRGRVEEQLRAAGLGPVEPLTITDVLGEPPPAPEAN